jgi:cysteine desulfurase
MNKLIYLDNAATTPVRKEVVDEMIPYFTEHYGNPSSLYTLGRENKEVVEEARKKVANTLNCDPKEIYFTSCGTESDNWAIIGSVFANKQKGNHIITTSIEHHAVFDTCKYLEKLGFEVTYLPVDKEGLISLQDLNNAITDKTILITIMYANNEIGTIQPIEEIGKIAREKNVAFHTDAVQAVGHIGIDVKKLNVDMLSLSAHKFNGPKGIGALYIRKGIKVDKYLHGGGQERRKRAGTENVAYIAGLGKAIELATDNMEEKNLKIQKLRDKLINGILNNIPYTILNGSRDKRLPGNVNIVFQYIEGESMLLMMDMKGIAVSSGSACTSGSLDPSHVLLALGLEHEVAHGSIRFTLGEENTEEEIDYVLEVLPGIVNKLREISPLYEEVERGVKNV